MERAAAPVIPNVPVGATMGVAGQAMRRCGSSWALVVDDGVVMGLVTAAQASSADPGSPVSAGSDGAEAALLWLDGEAGASARFAA